MKTEKQKINVFSRSVQSKALILLLWKNIQQRLNLTLVYYNSNLFVFKQDREPVTYLWDINKLIVFWSSL